MSHGARVPWQQGGNCKVKPPPSANQSLAPMMLCVSHAPMTPGCVCALVLEAGGAPTVPCSEDSKQLCWDVYTGFDVTCHGHAQVCFHRHASGPPFRVGGGECSGRYWSRCAGQTTDAECSQAGELRQASGRQGTRDGFLAGAAGQSASR